MLGLSAMLFSLLQDWLRVEQKLLDAAEIREVLVAQIRELEAQKNEGPRHTACDTKNILKDLRAGKVADHYSVEDRCKQSNE